MLSLLNTLWLQGEVVAAFLIQAMLAVAVQEVIKHLLMLSL
jgi:hypothetical protein